MVVVLPGGTGMKPLHLLCYLSTVALNIKDPETEQLAAEVAAMTSETKTGAIKAALRERKERLDALAARAARHQRIRRFLENEAWPQIPADVLGRPLSRSQREEILGYGPEGV